MMSPRFIEEKTSEHASSGQTLDCTYANDVAKACCAKEGCVAHAAKERGIWKLSTNVGVLNCGFTNANGDDVAHNHHQSNFRRPGESGRGDCEEVGQQHSGQCSMPHHLSRTTPESRVLRVVHPFLSVLDKSNH